MEILADGRRKVGSVREAAGNVGEGDQGNDRQSQTKKYLFDGGGVDAVFSRGPRTEEHDFQRYCRRSQVRASQFFFSFAFGRANDRSSSRRRCNVKLDLGVYPINFATMIFNERPVRVHAQGSLLATGVDDLAAITLTHRRRNTFRGGAVN